MLEVQTILSNPRPVLGFFPVAVAFIALELTYLKLARQGHDTRETLASRGVAVGDILSRTLTAPRGEPLRFGVKGREPSANPIRIALAEWGYLWHDFQSAQSWRSRAKVLFGTP